MQLKKEHLAVVWLSAEKRAAADMAFLYLRTCLLNRWFKRCELILWGPAVEAAATDADIQTELKLILNLGAEVAACEACALRYGVSAQLEAIGIPSRGMSEHLTELLCGGAAMMVI